MFYFIYLFEKFLIIVCVNMICAGQGSRVPCVNMWGSEDTCGIHLSVGRGWTQWSGSGSHLCSLSCLSCPFSGIRASHGDSALLYGSQSLNMKCIWGNANILPSIQRRCSFWSPSVGCRRGSTGYTFGTRGEGVWFGVWFPPLTTKCMKIPKHPYFLLLEAPISTRIFGVK